MKKSAGFTLIELLVVIALITLLSSVIFASMANVRKKARDSQRISNARQIGMALEQYELSNNTYKVSGAGLVGTNGGYVSKASSDDASYNTNSIISVLKSTGFYNSNILSDPLYGKENYYLGVCTSTNAYNIYLKLEQDSIKQSTSTIIGGCEGPVAASAGFNYIAATVGGNSGGVADPNFGGGGQAFSCGSTVSGTGADVLTYGTVLGGDNRCWLDRNLGATQIALTASDTAAYGGYYQWGRMTDGHQIYNSTWTSVLSPTDNPGNSSFIASSTSPFDWRIGQNDNLWQGVYGINNPCPLGFRVPTINEWNILIASSSPQITNAATAFANPLKLTMPGYRNNNGASYSNRGFYAGYWSSTVSGTGVRFLNFDAALKDTTGNYLRARAISLRCIKD